MRKMHPASLALGALLILPALSLSATGAVTAQPTDTTPSYATTTKVPTHSMSDVVRSIDAPKLVIERPQQYAQYGGNISLRRNLSLRAWEMGWEASKLVGVIVVRDWTARIPRAPQ
jgi:hypothetical protein